LARFRLTGGQAGDSIEAIPLLQGIDPDWLAATELATATAATIRVRLLKIGAALIRNTRRIRILFASHHPMRETFLAAARALASP
jgi:ABC-type microcin C transport system duplicated ATPase subunit YejF